MRRTANQTMKLNTTSRSILRIAVIYAVVCLMIGFFQRSLLYFPSHHANASSLTPWAHDGQTIGYCHEVASPETVWLMMHGNAGQAADRDYVLDRMSARDSLYVLEYPGYGQREGSPSKSSIDRAAADAYRALRQQHPDVPVCVIGESLGGGPASMLASEQVPPDKIVLITPFDSLYRVAAKRFFFLPVWLLLLDRWDNVAALNSYRGTVEIYGAKNDEVIPIAHAKALADSLPNARFTEISGGHNNWSYGGAVKIER